MGKLWGQHHQVCAAWYSALFFRLETCLLFRVWVLGWKTVQVQKLSIELWLFIRATTHSLLVVYLWFFLTVQAAHPYCIWECHVPLPLSVSLYRVVSPGCSPPHPNPGNHYNNCVYLASFKKAFCKWPGEPSVFIPGFSNGLFITYSFSSSFSRPQQCVAIAIPSFALKVTISPHTSLLPVTARQLVYYCPLIHHPNPPVVRMLTSGLPPWARCYTYSSYLSNVASLPISRCVIQLQNPILTPNFSNHSWYYNCLRSSTSAGERGII